MKVAPGDVVHVKGTVTSDSICDPTGFWVHFSTADNIKSCVWVFETDIIHVERAPLKVGDRVRWFASDCPVTLIAIDGKDGWVLYDSGEHGTIPLDEMERE